MHDQGIGAVVASWSTGGEWKTSQNLILTELATVASTVSDLSAASMSRWFNCVLPLCDDGGVAPQHALYPSVDISVITNLVRSVKPDSKTAREFLLAKLASAHVSYGNLGLASHLFESHPAALSSPSLMIKFGTALVIM